MMTPDRGAFIPKVGAQSTAMSVPNSAPTAMAPLPQAGSGGVTQNFDQAPELVKNNILGTSPFGSHSGAYSNYLDASNKNYNQFENKYGAGAIPWGLQQSGSNPQLQNFNYFYNPTGQTLQLGQNYGFQNNQYGQQSINRDPFTGGVAGYGKFQGASQQPINSSYWFGQTGISGGNGQPADASIDAMLKPMYDQMSTDPYNQKMSYDDFKRQAVLSSMPNANNSQDYAAKNQLGQGLSPWGQYANYKGYTTGNWSDYLPQARSGQGYGSM